MAGYNGGLSDAQIREMQKYYGTTVDGAWGPKSAAAAGGGTPLSAQQAWNQYQQQKNSGGGSYGGSTSYGGSSYNNGGLTTDQIVEMQNYYGTAADGLWGQNSTASAGGLNAQQAWQQYQQQKQQEAQQQMQGTLMPEVMGFEDFYNSMGGADFEKKLRESINASVQQAVNSYEAQRQETEQKTLNFEDFYNRMGGADFEKMLRESINASVQQAVNSYEAQRQETEQDAQEMSRQAYVAKLLGEKNMAQRLAAGGYAGGMAESAMLESEANYQNNLAEIQRQRQRALDEIQRAIDNARLTGDMEMANQLADYMAQVQSYYSDYSDQMLSRQMEIQRAIDNARLTGDMEMANQLADYKAQVQSYYNDYYDTALAQMQQAQPAASAVTPGAGGGTNYGGSSYASNDGVSANTVRLLQQQINSARVSEGLPPIAVDGVWGQETANAVGGMSASQYLDAYENYMNRNSYRGPR